MYTRHPTGLAPTEFGQAGRELGGWVDTDLVVHAQDGDHEAFERLAVAISDRIHGVAFNILRDRDLAEDATQQALLAVWRDLPQLRDPGRFEAWSYRILVRACHAEARRSRRWLSNTTPWPDDGPATSSADLDAVADRDLFGRGFARLSLDHRAVVVLHHYLGLTLDEVAEALGVSVGTVKSWPRCIAASDRGPGRLRTT